MLLSLVTHSWLYTYKFSCTVFIINFDLNLIWNLVLNLKGAMLLVMYVDFYRGSIHAHTQYYGQKKSFALTW